MVKILRKAIVALNILLIFVVVNSIVVMSYPGNAEGKDIIKQPTRNLAEITASGIKTIFAPSFVAIGNSKQITATPTITKVKSIDRKGKPIRELSKTKKIQGKIKIQRGKQDKFLNSAGFQRIEDIAGIITLARGKPIQERSFIGKVSQISLKGVMGFPFVAGGNIAFIGEKLKLTVGALITLGWQTKK